MGDAKKSTTTTKRHEYTLSSPTNWVEINKAVQWARREKEAALGAESLRWDDAIGVEARDDEVVVFWDEEV